MVVLDEMEMQERVDDDVLMWMNYLSFYVPKLIKPFYKLGSVFFPLLVRMHTKS